MRNDLRVGACAGIVTTLLACGPMGAQTAVTPVPAATTPATATTNATTGATGSTPTTGNSANATGAGTASGAGNATPAKRVWTNDDVTQLHGQTSISMVGKNGAKPATTATNASKAKPKTAAWYHDQIAKLQAQIPAIDEQIATLQAALSGKTIDETRKYNGVKLDDWPSELAALQRKRADIDDQIASLEDQARHDNVPANALP